MWAGSSVGKERGWWVVGATRLLSRSNSSPCLGLIREWEVAVVHVPFPALYDVREKRHGACCISLKTPL